MGTEGVRGAKSAKGARNVISARDGRGTKSAHGD